LSYELLILPRAQKELSALPYSTAGSKRAFYTALFYIRLKKSFPHCPILQQARKELSTLPYSTAGSKRAFYTALFYIRLKKSFLHCPILQQAQKELSRLPAPAGNRVAAAIRKLADTARPRGSRKLTGREGLRIRAGDYRVIYEIDDDNHLVTILHIGHRRDAYR
jgi:mRNA interferase RelE/StbE